MEIRDILIERRARCRSVHGLHSCMECRHYNGHWEKICDVVGGHDDKLGAMEEAVARSKRPK